MDVSKLALSVLIPDLGQLGHVHLDRLISRTGRGKEQRVLCSVSGSHNVWVCDIYIQCHQVLSE